LVKEIIYKLAIKMSDSHNEQITPNISDINDCETHIFPIIFKLQENLASIDNGTESFSISVLIESLSKLIVSKIKSISNETIQKDKKDIEDVFSIIEALLIDSNNSLVPSITSEFLDHLLSDLETTLLQDQLIEYIDKLLTQCVLRVFQRGIDAVYTINLLYSFLAFNSQYLSLRSKDDLLDELIKMGYKYSAYREFGELVISFPKLNNILIE
jgi:hypothetical protein